MHRMDKNIKFDSAIKLRSCRVILKRESLEVYRQNKISLSKSECKIILSSSETEEIMRKMLGKRIYLV